MTWRPVTETRYDPRPRVDEDPRAQPLDFVLTPRERDVAVQAQLHLEAHRRRLNELDNKRQAA